MLISALRWRENRCQRKALRSCSSSSSHDCDKILGKKHLGEGRPDLACRSTVWSIIVGGSRKRVYEAAGHMAFIMRKMRDEFWCSTHCLLIQFEIPGCTVAPLMFGVDLPFSINLNQEISPREPQRRASVVLLNLVKVTVKLTDKQTHILSVHHPLLDVSVWYL